MCITRLWLVVCHAVWVPSVLLGIHNDCLFDAMCIYAYPNYSPRIVHITFKLASLCTVAVHLTQCVLCMFMPMMFLLGVRYCLYPCHSMSRYTKTFPLCLMYIYIWYVCFELFQNYTEFYNMVLYISLEAYSTLRSLFPIVCMDKKCICWKFISILSPKN